MSSRLRKLLRERVTARNALVSAIAKCLVAFALAMYSNGCGQPDRAMKQHDTKSMKHQKSFFIAAHSREAAQDLKSRLNAAGYHITSRWITEDTKFNEGIGAYSDEERRSIAEMDEEDVRAAEAGLILLAELPGKTVPGGKHVETGIAIALGRPIYVIGRRENIFHWHPSVRIFETLEQLLEYLKLVG